MSDSKYEVVIGMECHAQLATATKLFCGCSTRFGAPPNTQTCPVCLGLPGSLPVPNRRAVEMALMTALALGCEVPAVTSFDRKNYYYPDLPKNYQISQDRRPIGERGRIELSGRTVSIGNVHIEEDAGKNLHGSGARAEARAGPKSPGVPATEGSGELSVVDLNRAGIPLVEIVTGPDMRSIDEAQEYMETLRATLLYLGVCEGKMQEGDLRFEASISLRPRGEAKLGARCEIKNLNSLKHVRDALEFEAGRQTRALDRGETLEPETRLWDEARGETARMRSKEEAKDYRYFPEPDIPAIAIDAAWREAVRASLPELPRARRARLAKQYALSEYDAGVLTSERALADDFEALAAKTGDAKAAANWIMNDVLARAKEHVGKPRPGPDALAALIGMVARGEVSGAAARQVVLGEMFATGADAASIVKAKGLAQESDRGALAAIVAEAIAASPKAIADWKAGKQAALGFLTGACMKLAKGRGNPKIFGELIREALAKA